MAGDSGGRAKRGAVRRRGGTGGVAGKEEKSTLVLAATEDWEVRDTKTKGRGLFAARDFQIGECIISEAPLIEGVRNWRGAWVGLLTLAALGWLLTGPGESLFGWAYRCTVVIMLKPAVFACYEALVLWSRVRALGRPEREQYYDLLSGGLPCYVPVLTELKAYRLNAVLGSDSGCVCATVSMINHSCLPNAAFSFSAASGSQEVQALRAVAKGEEVVTSYIDLWQTTDARRKVLRSALEFTCGCSACTATAFEQRRRDERRSRCRQLEMRVRTELGKDQVAEAVKALRELRTTAQEELGHGENLILQEMDRSVGELEAMGAGKG